MNPEVVEAVVDSITYMEEFYSKDPVIRRFFSSDIEISRLLGLTEHLIFQVIRGEKDVKSAAVELASDYIEKGFSYIPLANCIDRLKNEVIFRISSQSFDVQEKVRDIFDEIKKHIAKAYIMKELSLMDVEELKIGEVDLLYTKILQWIYDFKELLISGRYNEAITNVLAQGEINEAFENIDYRVRCINFILCERLKRSYKELQNSARDIAYLMSESEYETAYFMISDLKEKLNIFIRNLEKIHIVFTEDAENIFFHFVSQDAATPGEKTLLIVGFKNLLALSSVYTKKELDELIEKLKSHIHRLVSKKKNITFVKGAGGDFLIYARECVEDVAPLIRHEIDRFYREVNEAHGTIKPGIIMAGLKLEPFINISDDEARKSLYHLKSEAIKTGKAELILDKEKRISLIEEINKRYRNLKLISEVLAEESVDVHFQPIFRQGEQREFYCLEVLARLVVGGKYVPAGVFIDLLHEIDLIEKLDRLVARKLLSYSRHLPKVCSRVSINASPRSLKSDSFREELIRTCSTLMENGVIPIIELTEQSFLESFDTISQLSAKCNVKFGVDDFGTGYSSLKMVVDLAENGLLEMLKLDGSLVKQLPSSKKAEKIIRILLNISQELGVACVAEFVENEEISKRLRDIGVEYMQGYYLAIPGHLTTIMARSLSA